MSAVTTAQNQWNVTHQGISASPANQASILTLAINATALVLAYPYFRPIDPRNAMYHIAPVILQLPRFAPAHLPQPNAKFAGGSITGALRGAQPIQASQPPVKNVNSAVVRERIARQFGGKYAKRAKNANFTNFYPYR